MRKGFIRKVLIPVIAGMMLFALSACGSSASAPEYIFMAARDNGFVAAYRGYFSIDGNEFSVLSKRKYEKWSYGDEPNYASVPVRIDSLDVEAATPDPSEWKYDQNKYDDYVIDPKPLSEDIKRMGVSLTGNIYIEITSFYDIRIIEVTDEDDHTENHSHFAIFRGDTMLVIPNDVDLNGIRTVKVRR